MHWQQRMPQGMRYVSKSGNVTTFSLEMPVNDDGLYPLQCPQSTDHRFAVQINESDAGRAGEPELLHCPYCGCRGRMDAFYTPAQQHRFRDAGNAIAEQIAAEFAERISHSFTGSRHIRVSHSHSPWTRQLHTYVPEPSRRTVTCATCGEMYAVYGIALYCPNCGQLSAAECSAESLGVERRAIAHLVDLPSETRDQLEADGVLTRAYENTVKSTFTALEVLLGHVFRSRVSDAEAVSRGQGNIFQRLADASILYERHLGISLASLDTVAWGCLLESAALRHVLIHKDGIVDERYLRAVPSSRLLPGQRVHVGRAEAEATLGAADSVVAALLSALANTAT